jgi:mannose-6-phosphate isomerase-like protein (cupin superfamily)
MSIQLYGVPENPCAIVIRSTAKVDGIQFFSPPDFSQQLGLMTRPQGHKVEAHIHNEVVRSITHTQEVLFIRKGSCLVTLFNSNLIVTDHITLSEGDVILLAHGGHQIEMISECEILEVKQGPYAGENDKTRLTIQE